MATILLIDDDEFLREALSELLRHESYTVVVAEGGAQGLVAARQHLPDLILCDLMMPGLDGHGVLRALRQEEALAELPVIFLTALSRHEDRRQGMDLGADDYLVKPVSKQDLKRAIEARLAKRDQARLAQERKVNVFIQSLSSLLHDLRRLVPEPEALRLADGIAAMSDGLWLRYALTGKPANPETPRALTRDYLAAALARTSNMDRAGLKMLA